MQIEEFTVQLKPDCRRANTMIGERKSTAAAAAALNIPVFPPPTAHVPVPVSHAANLNGRHAHVYLAQRSSGGYNSEMGSIRQHLQSTRYNAKLVVVEAPEEKFRFRYASEMSGTHGCIHGNTYDKKNKTFPTIKVENVPEQIGKLTVRVGLYTRKDKHAHHVHKLMMKGVSERDDKEDFIEVETTREKGFTVVWKGLGIIHTSRSHYESTLCARKMKVALEKKRVESKDKNVRLNEVEEVQIKHESSMMKKDGERNNNLVYLGWEAFRVIDGVFYPICEMIFSDPIRNLKNPRTGDLKITRTSKGSGTVEGHDEIFIFTERVIKEDIRIRFYQEADNGDRVWEAEAFFQESDVHHQYAIAFKTPPYVDLKVEECVEVYFELYRPSDQATSSPIPFRYTPVPSHSNRKRRHFSHRFTESSQYRPETEALSPMSTAGSHGTAPLSPVSSIMAEPSASPPQLVIDPMSQQVNIQYDDTNQLYHMDFSTIDALQLSCPDQNSSVGQRSGPRHGLNGLNGHNVQNGHGVGGHGYKLPSIGSRTWANMDHGRMTDLSHNFVIPVGGGIIQRDGTTSIKTKVIMPPPPSPAPSSNPQTLDEIVDTIKEYEKMFRDKKRGKGVEEKIKHFLGFTTSDGDNLLHTGVINGDVDVFRYLLQATLTFNCLEFLNEKNKEGNTPLHLAISFKSNMMTRLLLEAGANPNMKNLEGNSAVHLALIVGNSQILTLLLTVSRTNPHLNVANNEGLFPFHLAVLTGKLEIVIIMKEQGCDYNIRDRVSGSTPLHLALKHGFSHITRFNRGKEDFQEIERYMTSILYLVLKAMVNPEVANFAGVTSVQLAAELGMPHLLKEANEIHGPVCTLESDSILTDWVTEQLCNEDISLNDFMEKDLKKLESHLRPFGRWKLLAEELKLRDEIIRDLARKHDPPVALLSYLKDIDWKVKTLAEALAKILVKDEEP